MRRLGGIVALLGALLLPLAGAAGTAHADDPITLSRTGQITDKVGALGDRKQQVADALEKLYAGHRIQLFVAYVNGFSGRDAQEWANATAQRNGLGQNDVLLAVATHDRQYAVSADQSSGFTQSQLDEVNRSAIEPALKQNDWAGAAIGAANGFGAVLGGQPVVAPAITPGTEDPGGGSGGNGSSSLWIPVAAVGSAGVLGALVYSRRKRGSRGAPPQGGGWGRGGAAERPRVTPLPELDAQAKQLLVETDDAVRTSQEELGFAAAQFGDEAAQPFTEAVSYARGELTAAFRLRQKLDDAFPEDEATRRLMLDEILSRCTQANRRLDAESDAFDRLRALESNAPQALAQAEATAAALDTHVTAAETAIGTLTRTYADAAVEPVTGHPAEARDRLVFAGTAIDGARKAIDAGDMSRAAVFVRAAEGALDQAGTLAESVVRRAEELEQADARLQDALTGTDTDLADAKGLLSGTADGAPTADLRGRIARAESVLGDVRQELTAGRHDPISGLRRIEEADAALDAALTGAREGAVNEQRARGLLGQALLAARSEVAAARDVITTHRGAIGSQARTRLAEAERRLEQAESLAATDAAGALSEAQQADQLACQAQQFAQQDVSGGGFGGGGRGGGGMSGAVLGGIILGGGGTRGRMGGGGRF